MFFFPLFNTMFFFSPKPLTFQTFFIYFFFNKDNKAALIFFSSVSPALGVHNLDKSHSRLKPTGTFKRDPGPG